MKIEIELSPKEITALVEELQERSFRKLKLLIDGKEVQDAVENEMRRQAVRRGIEKGVTEALQAIVEHHDDTIPRNKATRDTDEEKK